MDSPLRRPVESFVADFAPVLVSLAAELPLADPAKLPGDVALEAFNLAAAFVDADGRHTDEELAAFVSVFAARFDTVARAGSPAALRAAGLLAGRRTFLDRPSPLFDVLVQADLRSGTGHAWRYYLDAVDIAHAVFALDDVPTNAELMAVERFRATLLRAMDEAGLPRPGGPRVEPRPAPATTPSPTAPGPTPAEPAEPAGPARPLEELLAELDGLIGLAAVKAEVKLATNLLRVEKLRTERGLPVVERSRHLVFTGNPGTGKTTVARLLAEIYRTLGVVTRGQLVESDRSGLVAGYVGQTAIKVRDVFQSALGGVLLIDEAYALVRGRDGDFGHEAVDAIVKLMEDHREEVVLIVAGYPEEMAEFLDANPGLRSRFPKTIFFDDYSDDELVRIFDAMAEKSHYTPTDGARAALRAYVAARPRDRGFGNARLVRNVFEAAVAAQASRVVELTEVTDDALVTLEAADIPAGDIPAADIPAAGIPGPGPATR